MARRDTRHSRKKKPARAQKPWQQNRTVWIASIAIILIGALLILPQRRAEGGLPREGQPIADFTVTDVDGRTFQLSEAYRENEIILVFYRGHG